MDDCVLSDVYIFTGYSYIGSAREFVWKNSETVKGVKKPSRFYFKGLVLEYDVEALMIRTDLYLRTPDNKEYIVKGFQLDFLGEGNNVSGTANDLDLLFEKFPEMKTITSSEKLVVNKKTQLEAFKTVSNIIHNVKEGYSIDIIAAQDVSERLVNDVLAAPEALINLMDIKSFDDYTFTHNINVTTISLFIGESLGMSKDDLNELGMGCLLHDIGKINISKDILNKNGKLTEKEFEEIKRHPENGFNLVKKSKNISDRSKRIILEHHEKFDGRGYPKKLKGESISYFGRICAIADVYDALTTDRPYRVAMQPYDAIKVLIGGIDNQFDPHILNSFVRKFSIYPSGSLVKLNNQSIALVLRNNPQAVIRPVLRILTDANGHHLKDRIEVDLLTDKTLFITGPAERSALNITEKNA